MTAPNPYPTHPPAQALLDAIALLEGAAALIDSPCTCSGDCDRERHSATTIIQLAIQRIYQVDKST